LITLLLHKEKESGLFHVDVSLGNPAVSQRLVVDTGSRWTAVQCYASQRRRQKGSSHYDPLKSSTSRKIVTATTSTVVKEQYEDGSYWSGYEVYDDLMLTDSTMGMSFLVHTMQLACQTNASRQFHDDKTATGILGLEYNPTMSLPALLRGQGTIRDNTFSICVGQRQGLLTFGGAAVDRHQERMTFTPIHQWRHPLINNTGFYVVHVKSVWLGTMCLVSHAVHPEILEQFNIGRGTVLDTGSSDTYFPMAMEPVLNKAWKASISTKHDFSELDGVLSYDDIVSFPNLTIVMENGPMLFLSPRHYNTGFDDDRSCTADGRRAIVRCTIHCTEPSGAVLGVNALVDRDVWFDAERQRIGIAAAHCDDD
jgi:hypothetical protein